MKCNFFLLLIIPLSLFLIGCASINVIPLSSKTYPSKPDNCNIQVLTSFPKDKQYEELCILSARGGQSVFEGKSVADLIPKMKKEACRWGADAIVITDAKEGGYNFAQPADRAQATSTAIKFLK